MEPSFFITNTTGDAQGLSLQLSTFQHISDTPLFSSESCRCKVMWHTPERPGTVSFNLMPDHLSATGHRIPRSRENMIILIEKVSECCTSLSSERGVRTKYNILEMRGRGPCGVASGSMVTPGTCTTLPTQENGGNTTTSESGLITKTFADQFDVSTKVSPTNTP